MILADLHIHSVYSNGYFRNFPPWVASTPEEILQKAKKEGLGVIAIVDHDSLKGSLEAAKISSRYGIVVVPACEISTAEGHLLAYGLKKEIPKKLSARKTINLVHRQGGLAFAAHPFFEKVKIIPSKSLGKKVLDLDLDGWEVANASSSDKANFLALKMLKIKGNSTAIGGSDTHVLDFIGFGVTVFKNKITNSEEVMTVLRQGKAEGRIRKKVPVIDKYFASFRDQFKFLYSSFSR